MKITQLDPTIALNEEQQTAMRELVSLLMLNPGARFRVEDFPAPAPDSRVLKYFIEYHFNAKVHYAEITEAEGHSFTAAVRWREG